MSNRSIGLSEALHEYLLEASLREPDVMRRLREETARMEEAEMQIAPEQGQFMALLARLMGAQKALEVGVFTGYSALAVARALPPDGTLVALDREPAYTRVAERYWTEAGVRDKIDLRHGEALGLLDVLLEEGAAGTFDLAFIDAAKTEYAAYYEYVLRLLRPGGLAVLDNVLRDGRVADPAATDDGTEAVRVLNAKLRGDGRIDLSLIPVADGLTLARKR